MPPGHTDARTWMPSTVTRAQSRPNLGGYVLAVLRKTPSLGRFVPVAVVEKFRSRIRILQFSTRKITPHGCVYVSSARPPIVVFFGFVLLYAGGTNLGIDSNSPSRLTPPPRPLRRGARVMGFFMQNSVKKGPSQDANPHPQGSGR